MILTSLSLYIYIYIYIHNTYVTAPGPRPGRWDDKLALALRDHGILETRGKQTHDNNNTTTNLVNKKSFE